MYSKGLLMSEITLQISDDVSWEKISGFLAPYIKEAGIKKLPAELQNRSADWIGGNFKIENFNPFTRDDIYAR
jgi:hypothetical protein